MSVRIARDSGALLSATDSPVQTGHASSFASRDARADAELLGLERAMSTTTAITTTAASASHAIPHLRMRLRLPALHRHATSEDSPSRQAAPGLQAQTPP